MAGVHIKLTIEDRELQHALRQLHRLGEDKTDLFRDMGEQLLNSTKARFETEQAPDGTPWEPLADSTKQHKKKNKDRILTLEGDLGDTGLAYQADADQLLVGSSLIYAATHQLGDETRNIPARPFLGLSDEDNADIIAIINDHINQAIA